MSQAQTFHALVCPWTYSHERIRAILDASGITVLRQANPSEIVDFIATARTLPKVIITSIESGGLAIASTLRTVSETAHKFDVPPMLLFDHTGELASARAALRMKVADYLCLSLPDHVLIERLQEQVLRIGFSDASPSNFANLQDPQITATTSDGQIHWDASIAAIYNGGTWLQLSPVEWRLFEMLLQHRGETVPSFNLISGPLGRSAETATTSSLLRLHLSRLRAKMEEHKLTGINIVTVRSRGYKLI